MSKRAMVFDYICSVEVAIASAKDSTPYQLKSSDAAACSSILEHFDNSVVTTISTL